MLKRLFDWFLRAAMALAAPFAFPMVLLAAAIPSSRVSRKWQTSALGQKIACFYVENVDTADTIDLSDDFNEIVEATGLASDIPGTVVGSGTVAAQILTLATMADANVVLVVKGNAA